MSHDLSIPQELHVGARPMVKEALGSFWSSVFSDQALVDDLLAARVLSACQAHIDAMEALSLRNHNSSPAFHREHWHPVLIRLSQRNKARGFSIGMQDTPVIGPQPEDPEKTVYLPGEVFEIGGNAEYSRVNTYPFVAMAGASLVRVKTCITDSISAPKHILTQDSDFAVEDGVLVIRKEQDPFDVEGYRIVEDEDDKIAVLWCCDAEFDTNNVTDFLGYPMGIAVPSTEKASRMLSAVWDAVVFGVTPRYLNAALGAVFDVPTVVSDTTVEDIILDPVEEQESAMPEPSPEPDPEPVEAQEPVTTTVTFSDKTADSISVSAPFTSVTCSTTYQTAGGIGGNTAYFTPNANVGNGTPWTAIFTLQEGFRAAINYLTLRVHYFMAGGDGHVTQGNNFARNLKFTVYKGSTDVVLGESVLEASSGWTQDKYVTVTLDSENNAFTDADTLILKCERVSTTGTFLALVSFDMETVALVEPEPEPAPDPTPVAVPEYATVVTTDNTYRVIYTKLLPSVVKGATLRAGDFLTDDITVYSSLSKDEVRELATNATLSGLSLLPGNVIGVSSTVVIENRTSTLEDGGWFKLNSGDTASSDFWKAVFARTTEEERTALFMRLSQDGSTVNPLIDLGYTILANTVLIISKVGLADDPCAPLVFDLLSSLIPSYAALTVAQTVSAEDSMDLAAVSDEIEALVTDTQAVEDEDEQSGFSVTDSVTVTFFPVAATEV